jgi:ABC-type nitrate/sulfonate/bicarbonate transport system substrate-binding protein
MGFADFRAAFSAGTGEGWTVTPSEGSLAKKEETQFLLKYKAQNPGVSEGYLVVETEDFKKTWKIIGSPA